MRIRQLTSVGVLILTLLLIVKSSAVAATFQQTTPLFQVQVLENANLREGPGESYPRIGGAKAGEQFDVVAENEAGDWYEIAAGYWISAALVQKVATIEALKSEQEPTPAKIIEPPQSPSQSTTQPVRLPDAHNPKKALVTTGIVDLAENELMRLGRGEIKDIAVSPDTRYFAVAASTGTWIYSFEQLDNGQLLRNTELSSAVAWSPDGQSLAVVNGDEDSDQTVSLINVADSTLLRSWGDVGEVWDISWSPNGQYVASCSGSFVDIRSAATGDVVSDITEETDFAGTLAWSPDSALIVSAGPNKTATVWDVATGEQLYSILEEDSNIWGTTVSWSPDGKSIAIGSFDGKTLVWDVQAREMRHDLSGSDEDWLADSINALSWSSDGSYLISASDEGDVVVRELATGTSIRKTELSLNWVTSLDFTTDGEELVSATSNGHVQIWDINLDRPYASLWGHADLDLASWLPSGKELLVRTQGTLQVVNAATGDLIRAINFPGDDMGNVVVSPNGAMAAVTDADGELVILDVANVRMINTLDTEDRFFWQLEWSPDQRYVAAARDDGTIVIWDIIASEVVKELSEHTKFILDLAWSPDGLHLVSASTDGTVLLWDALTWKVIDSSQASGHVAGVEWSPDGSLLMIDFTDEPATLQEFRGNIFFQFAPGSRFLTWSPDGRSVYLQHSDGSISAFCLPTWSDATSWHMEPIEAEVDMMWSPMGDSYIISTDDGTLRLFSGSAEVCDDPA